METVSSSDSPARLFQAEDYPPVWKGGVPRLVKMACTVRSDSLVLLKILGGGNSGGIEMVAHKDQVYECWVNSHGAVAVILKDGRLGVKPYEFEVVDWWQIKQPPMEP